MVLVGMEMRQNYFLRMYNNLLKNLTSHSGCDLDDELNCDLGLEIQQGMAAVLESMDEFPNPT